MKFFLLYLYIVIAFLTLWRHVNCFVSLTFECVMSFDGVMSKFLCLFLICCWIVSSFDIMQHKNQIVNEELWKEAQTYGDLQLMPFVDYYSLITWKTLAICIFGVMPCHFSLARRVLPFPLWPHLCNRHRLFLQNLSWRQMMMHLFVWTKC